MDGCRTTDYSALITFGTPLTMSDISVKRDIIPVARLDMVSASTAIAIIGATGSMSG